MRLPRWLARPILVVGLLEDLDGKILNVSSSSNVVCDRLVGRELLLRLRCPTTSPGRARTSSRELAGDSLLAVGVAGRTSSSLSIKANKNCVLSSALDPSAMACCTA